MTRLLTFVDAVSADCFSEVAAYVFMALGGVSESLVCYYLSIFGFGRLVLVGQAHVLAIEVHFRLDQRRYVIRILGQSRLYSSLNSFFHLIFLIFWLGFLNKHQLHRIATTLAALNAIIQIPKGQPLRFFLP